jgi:hypothetical protein
MTARILLLLALAGVSPASAQSALDPVVGEIRGPDNGPVAGQTVVLHRVQEAGGGMVGDAVTAGDGRFELRFPADTDTSALYFVATRYEDELYIGPPFRAGEQSLGVQVIQVGVPGTSASALMGGTAATAQPLGRPLTNRNWLLLVIPLVGVAAVAVYALIPRSSVPADRALLIRMAELDERMSTLPPVQQTSLREERSRLSAQWRER